MRTKLRLGFAVLALLAALGGVVALLSLSQVSSSFKGVEESVPLVAALSRLKDLIAQNESLVAAYLAGEGVESLPEREKGFAGVRERFLGYLEAFRLGSESDAFRSSPYFASWGEEAFPYRIHALPKGSSLLGKLEELEKAYLDYEEKTARVRAIHQEYLVTLRERNEKAIALDEPVRVMMNFTKLVDDSMKKIAKPANDTFFFVLRYLANSDPKGELPGLIDFSIQSFQESTKASTVLSEETKKTLIEKVQDFQAKWKAFFEVSQASGKEREEKFTEVYRSFSSLSAALEKLRPSQMVERLSVMNGERKNFLLLSGEEQKKAQEKVEESIVAFRKFLEEDFPKTYSVLATQGLLNERWKPFEDGWRETVAKTERIAALLEENEEALAAMQQSRRSLAEAMEAVNEEVFTLLEASFARVGEVNRSSSRLLYGVVVLAIALALLLGLFLSRSVTVPIGEALAFAATLEKGDLTRETGRERDDEFGRLLASLGEASQSLRGFLKEVAHAAWAIIEGMGRLEHTSREIASTGDQIAQTIAQVAKGSEEQSQSLHLVSQRMEKLLL
ncbi:MAG: hypothetical protein N2205_00795, partial [Candidatus Caldatribacterium sp.]|nr:hypothetical protein [Candidatus Caldatribacterium sp.]